MVGMKGVVIVIQIVLSRVEDRVPFKIHGKGGSSPRGPFNVNLIVRKSDRSFPDVK